MAPDVSIVLRICAINGRGVPRREATAMAVDARNMVMQMDISDKSVTKNDFGVKRCQQWRFDDVVGR